MKQEEREKLEELLEKLESDFLNTYGQIRAILDAAPAEDEDDDWDLDEEDEDDDWDIDDEDDWDSDGDDSVEIVIDLDDLFDEEV